MKNKRQELYDNYIKSSEKAERDYPLKQLKYQYQIEQSERDLKILKLTTYLGLLLILITWLLTFGLK